MELSVITGTVSISPDHCNVAEHVITNCTEFRNVEGIKRKGLGLLYRYCQIQD